MDPCDSYFIRVPYSSPCSPFPHFPTETTIAPFGAGIELGPGDVCSGRSDEVGFCIMLKPTWEFPKIRGTSFWGPYSKDPTIQGTILGSPILETPMLKPT